MKLHLCYLSYHPRGRECGVSLEVRLNYITILCNLTKVPAIILLAEFIYYLLHLQKTLECSIDLLHLFVTFGTTTVRKPLGLGKCFLFVYQYFLTPINFYIDKVPLLFVRAE